MFLYPLLFENMIFNSYNGGGQNLFMQFCVVGHVYHVQFYTTITHSIVVNTAVHSLNHILVYFSRF